MSVLERLKFLVENPEIAVQTFAPDEAEEILKLIEGETAAYRAGYEDALEDVRNRVVELS